MSHQSELTAESRYCADTFNGAVASAAISAAWEIGLLDELEQKKRVEISEFAKLNDAHPATLRSILLALSSRAIVELDADRLVATTGPGFDQAFSAKGFFYWLTRGCGELFTTLPLKVRNDSRNGRGARRDARAISVACRSIAQSFFDPPFRDLIKDIDFAAMADLGCGSGDRIVMLAELRPDIRAVGVDVSDAALAVSGEAVAEARLENRVTLVRDDVLNLSARPEYEDVELVTCFLMGHDFWPRENCLRTLRLIRERFPNARNLILGDTCRSTDLTGPQLPVFTLGFETVHAVMGQYLPTAAQWESVLAESAWQCADHRMIEQPAFSFVFRLTPR